MRIFGKSEEKEEEYGQGYPPVDRVKELLDSGMSDKDVINQLKEEGFSYSEIERAMVQSMKMAPGGGIEAVPVSFTYGPGEAPKEAPERQEPPMPPLPGGPATPGPRTEIGPPAGVSMPPGESEQAYPPEFAVEEIVEGVVEEKWEKFNRRLDDIRTDQSNIREEINSLLTEVKGLRIQLSSKDEDITDRLDDLEKRLEETEAKSGGLERVFKQFFPKIFDKALSAKKMGSVSEEEELGAA